MIEKNHPPILVEPIPPRYSSRIDKSPSYLKDYPCHLASVSPTVIASASLTFLDDSSASRQSGTLYPLSLTLFLTISFHTIIEPFNLLLSSVRNLTLGYVWLEWKVGGWKIKERKLKRKWLEWLFGWEGSGEKIGGAWMFSSQPHQDSGSVWLEVWKNGWIEKILIFLLFVWLGVEK